MNKTAFLIFFSVFISNLVFAFIVNKWIYILIYCLISLLFLFIFYFFDKKYNIKINLFNESLRFIENSLYSFETMDSFNYVITSNCKNLSKKTYLKICNNLENSEEVLEKLNKIYNFYIFSIFKKIILIYNETGGNILSYTNNLISEERRLFNLNNEYNLKNFNNVFSFQVLWFFSFLILILAKLSISSFFSNITNNNYFIIVIFIGMLLYLISNFLFISNLYKTEYIKEQKYEKIK